MAYAPRSLPTYLPIYRAALALRESVCSARMAAFKSIVRFARVRIASSNDQCGIALGFSKVLKSMLRMRAEVSVNGQKTVRVECWFIEQSGRDSVLKASGA